MTTLPLAVGIADAILAAARNEIRLDPTQAADELIRRYPTEGVSPADIVSTLREEARSAGLCHETC